MRTHKAHARDTQFTARVKGARAHAQCAIRNSPPGSKAHARTHNARYAIHRQGQRRTRARTMRDTQFTARVKGACAHAQCTIRNSPPGSKAHAHTQCAIHNSPPGSKACVRTHNARYTIHNVQRGPKHCSVYDVCCSVSYTIRNAQCTTLVKIHHWYFTHKKATHARYLNSPCKPHLT